MVRVIHHMPDPLRVLRNIRGTLTPGATFILEFANKRNAKAIARYMLRKQTWSPFDKAPVEFVELNYDFHPEAMRGWLDEAGFVPGTTLAVSSLRIGALKRRVPLNVLTTAERVIQPTGAVLPLSPSLFVRNQIKGAKNAPKQAVTPLASLFVNPDDPSSTLVREGDTLRCPKSGARWAIHDGIYDFKQPL